MYIGNYADIDILRRKFAMYNAAIDVDIVPCEVRQKMSSIMTKKCTDRNHVIDTNI